MIAPAPSTMTFRSFTAAGAAVLALVLPLAGPSNASAARVTVPADRADPAAGTISLNVQRQRATGRRRGTIMYLAGGPGSAATAELGATARELGSRLRRTRDIVAFDARGTGRSRVVRCPELQRDQTLRSTAAASRCAERLGARRGHFTIDEQIADIEDVRRSLGIERMDLFGISYGTEVAQRYAQAHPERVGRVVLDSVLPAEGASSLGLEIFSGLDRVLRELCTRKRCPSGVADPRTSLAQLVGRLRQGPLRAPVFGPRGRRRAEVLDAVRVIDVLLAGDFSPALRAALPSALQAAAAGDAAPLLRLGALDRATTPRDSVRAFSNGMYAATSCESLQFPWDPAADPGTRRAQASARLAEMDPALFAPFDPQTVLDADFLPLCIQWPAPVRPAQPHPGEIPPLPTLLVAGEEDLRTPVESARVVAARNPNARLLTVPATGHSVISSDDSGCARRAIRAFLRRVRGPRTCRGPRPFVSPVRAVPARLRDLGPVRNRRERIRRTIAALDATLDDVTVALVMGAVRGGGLRAGRFALRFDGVLLRGYSYVRGVRFDATPLRRGGLKVRVRGRSAARGRLRVSPGGRVRGRLGGRRLVAQLKAGPPTG